MIPVVMETDGFELDNLRRSADQHSRFLYLKPSTRILDAAAFEARIDAEPGPAWLFARPSCYLAIYTAETLASVLASAPARVDKLTSIIWESRLHRLLRYPTIWPTVSDRTAKRIDVVDGRPELVIGNDVVEKLKGTAHCPRCPHAPVPGLCQHYLRRFAWSGSSATPRRTSTV